MPPTYPLVQPDRQPIFSLQGFDAAISSAPGGKGVAVIHQRALRCPGGLDSAQDMRRSHEDHLGCSGGYLYRPAGTCSILFTGNSKQERGTEAGIVASASASVTLSRFYSDGVTPVRVSQYDRLYLPDDSVLVETWELFDSSPSGVDKLKYPAVEVMELVTAGGQWMTHGDFLIEGGKLRWPGTRRPELKPDGRGEVCSVRYLYRPYWYVQSMHHDLRLVTQAAVAADGTVGSVVQVYQACPIMREFYFESEYNDPEAKDPTSPRQRRPPQDPQFGPR